MATSLFVRNLARRAVERSFRAQVAPSIGSVRFSSVYSKDHEYCKVEDGIGSIGISDFAQSELGDIVFIELPEVGDTFEKGDSIASVESVKAVSDVYSPVTGEVVEVNEALEDSPQLVNDSPEGDGWFVKLQLSDESELESLMTAEAYKEYLNEK